MPELGYNTGVIKPVECFKEGWELIRDRYWILFAISLVGATIGSISLYLLIGAMICGIFYCFLRVIDGEEVKFEHLFKGFKFFLPSLLVTALIVVPMIIVFSVIYIPLLINALLGSRMSGDEMLALFSGTLVVDLILMFAMVCLHTLLLFAFPLIADRGLSGWGAVKLSASAVWNNLSGVTGIWAVGFIISVVGILLCFVGTYFAIPIILAGNTVAYRKVFPKQ